METMLSGALEFLVNAAHADQTAVGGGGVSPATAPDPGNIIVNVYNFSLMLGGILAFGMIVYGAAKYTLAGGNPAGQSDARDIITQALLGLLLLVGAFIVLNLVNPEITHLGLPKLGQIQPVREAPPAVGGHPGLTQGEAMRQLDAGGIVIAGPIKLAGIQQSTVNEAIRLKQECNCNVTITSATGGTHNTGTYSHANGYKMDLRLDNGLNNYIEKSGKFERAGTRSDGAVLYKRKDGGVIYARESDHWDVTVKLQGGATDQW